MSSKKEKRKGREGKYGKTFRRKKKKKKKKATAISTCRPIEERLHRLESRFYSVPPRIPVRMLLIFLFPRPEIPDTIAPLTLYRGFIGNSSSRSSLENLSSVLDTKDLGIRGKGIRF